MSRDQSKIARKKPSKSEIFQSKTFTVKEQPSKNSASLLKSGTKLKVTKQQKEEDKYFLMNALLVSSLLPLIPTEERQNVHKWLKKLCTTKKSPTDRLIRNDYIWFLLVQLECGVVTLPFIKEPPQGNLEPVTEAVEREIYEQILKAANNRSVDMDDLTLPPRNITTNGAQVEYQRVRPSEFLENQPKPKFGFIAYGACFSDQLNNK